MIEPSPLVRSRLVELISELALVEFVFSSGRRDALEAVSQLSPDLVIVDVGAGARGGLAKLQRIKRGSGTAALLVLTNHASDEYRRRCLDAGADYFLDKSLEFERLPALVRSRLHSKPARKPARRSSTGAHR